MAGLVSEDVPEGEGPNAEMQFGQATQAQQQAQTLASTGAPPGQAQTPPTPAQNPVGPAGFNPQQMPGPAMPSPPVQPPPPVVQRGIDDRLNINAVFSPPTILVQQWNEWLKNASQHPNVGPALSELAAMIGEQAGQSQSQQLQGIQNQRPPTQLGMQPQAPTPQGNPGAMQQQ